MSGKNCARTAAPVRGNVESLESRVLMSADYRSIDGVGNNLLNASWGAAGVDLLRYSPAMYGDRISTPGGANRPSARAISNAIVAQSLLPNGEVGVNNRKLTAMVYAFGQFIDHDIDFTDAGTPTEEFDVAVPEGDSFFDPVSTGTQTIALTRSEFDPATGTGPSNPRQQINEITAYLDGSVIYGSDPTRAAALRTMSGGQLRTSDGNLLPYNTEGFKNQNQSPTPNDQMFLAGDVRPNENIELTSLQVIFMREHNRLAAQIAVSNPGLDDEALFQQARQIVIGELQSITYNEFLPAMLGTKAISKYKGYKANVNPGIATEFSTAAYRVGHTMLGTDVEFFDDNGNAVAPEIPLDQAFFNPAKLKETGVDPLLKYLASDQAREIDGQLVDSVRNFLFGPPGAGGFDLASLNIQRGRDHGLADYNTTRQAYGLPRVTSFDQITSDPVAAHGLQEMYGTVDNIDLWVGGLAEDHTTGGSVGPTFTKIIADQFERLRDGDRLFYKRVFKGKQLREIENTTLADIIKRNTGLTNLQDDVFTFKVNVSGKVFSDSNADGIRQKGEKVLKGEAMQVMDADGSVIGSTTTDKKGRYSINDIIEPGAFTLHCGGVGSSGSGSATQGVLITKADNMKLDFFVTPAAYSTT